MAGQPHESHGCYKKMLCSIFASVSSDFCSMHLRVMPDTHNLKSTCKIHIGELLKRKFPQMLVLMSITCSPLSFCFSLFKVADGGVQGWLPAVQAQNEPGGCGWGVQTQERSGVASFHLVSTGENDLSWPLPHLLWPFQHLLSPNVAAE